MALHHRGVATAPRGLQQPRNRPGLSRGSSFDDVVFRGLQRRDCGDKTYEYAGWVDRRKRHRSYLRSTMTVETTCFVWDNDAADNMDMAASPQPPTLTTISSPRRVSLGWTVRVNSRHSSRGCRSATWLTARETSQPAICNSWDLTLEWRPLDDDITKPLPL